MSEHQVIVVGAGPAGLTAAVTLAHYGIEVLVVERRPSGTTSPRATGLSMRTMEVLRSWGLEDEILAGGNDVENTMLETTTAAAAADGTSIEVGFPSAHQSRLVSPTHPACVPQDHLEEVLLRRLSTLPTATVVFGVEAVLGAERTTRPTVSLVDHRRGERRAVTADYVIAADGARSAVRRILGIELVGQDRLMEGFHAEIRAPLWDVLGPHRHLIYSITTPEAFGTLLPAGQGDRWIFGGPPEIIGTLADDAAAALVRRRVQAASGVPDLPVEVGRITRFSSGAQLATTFSRGRVFLTGDAAHRVTPRGGTGLNTAVGDGHDLGWKIGWVLRGWAHPELLATYERERRPVAAHNVARSADPMGTPRQAVSELHIDLGGRIPHTWLDRQRRTADGRGRSSLDVLGPGLTLFAGPKGAGWVEAVHALDTSIPVEVRSLTFGDARALGIGASGATLVRPDGVPVVAWWSATGDPADLRRAVGRATVGMSPDHVAAGGRAA
jgi:2-polyprenyl-6-methoxyphenol hydroxylase-like FAD-dependent oxidoreductase